MCHYSLDIDSVPIRAECSYLLHWSSCIHRTADSKASFFRSLESQGFYDLYRWNAANVPSLVCSCLPTFFDSSLSTRDRDPALFARYVRHGLLCPWVPPVCGRDLVVGTLSCSKVQETATGLSPSLSAGEIQKWSDDYARKTSELKWSTERTRKTLESLAATGADLRAKDVAPPIQARRAERLVLGLDRLVNASGAKVKAALDHELDNLYARVQSLPDFDPLKFADSLDKFSSKLQASR